MGAKTGKKARAIKMPLCQAWTHLPGYPKHLREWWCHQPTPDSILEAIKEYKLRCAPDKEQHVLQGMIKKISHVVNQPSSHTGFWRTCPLLRTPSGILHPVSRHFWSLPDKDNGYNEINNSLEIIQWEIASPREVSSAALQPINQSNHLELF
jgi:hypothetical protein